MSNQTPSNNTRSETDKFLDWYKAERKRGLVDIKFFTQNTQEATQETFFAEVNAMLSAKPVHGSVLI
jgi:hypothetical protein